MENDTVAAAAGTPVAITPLDTHATDFMSNGLYDEAIGILESWSYIGFPSPGSSNASGGTSSEVHVPRADHLRVLLTIAFLPGTGAWANQTTSGSTVTATASLAQRALWQLWQALDLVWDAERRQLRPGADSSSGADQVQAVLGLLRYSSPQHQNQKQHGHGDRKRRAAAAAGVRGKYAEKQLTLTEDEDGCEDADENGDGEQDADTSMEDKDDNKSDSVSLAFTSDEDDDDEDDPKPDGGQGLVVTPATLISADNLLDLLTFTLLHSTVPAHHDQDGRWARRWRQLEPAAAFLVSVLEMAWCVATATSAKATAQVPRHVVALFEELGRSKPELLVDCVAGLLKERTQDRKRWAELGERFQAYHLRTLTLDTDSDDDSDEEEESEEEYELVSGFHLRARLVTLFHAVLADSDQRLFANALFARHTHFSTPTKRLLLGRGGGSSGLPDALVYTIFIKPWLDSVLGRPAPTTLDTLPDTDAAQLVMSILPTSLAPLPPGRTPTVDVVLDHYETHVQRLTFVYLVAASSRAGVTTQEMMAVYEQGRKARAGWLKKRKVRGVSVSEMEARAKQVEEGLFGVLVAHLDE